MSKEINKQILKLNKKVDTLIKKYKKQNEARKKTKDKEFIAKVMEYYAQFDNESLFFAALESGVKK